MGGEFLFDRVGVLSSGFKFLGEDGGDEFLHLLIDGCGGFGSDGKGVWRDRSSINRIGSVTGQG